MLSIRLKLERLDDDLVFASENENAELLFVVMESVTALGSGCFFLKHPKSSLC